MADMRKEWETEQRERTASLWDLLAQTAPDKKHAKEAKRSAEVYRWLNERADRLPTGSFYW